MRNPLPCPAPGCKGNIKVRNSGSLLFDERTGLFVRECLIYCTACGRKGKMLVTLDIALYLDENRALSIDPTPFPSRPAA